MSEKSKYLFVFIESIAFVLSCNEYILVLLLILIRFYLSIRVRIRSVNLLEFVALLVPLLYLIMQS